MNDKTITADEGAKGAEGAEERNEIKQRCTQKQISSFEQDGITVRNERCESVLASMDDSSIDLIVTDPPYFAG
jgi:predicted methyltransferase